MPRSLVSYLVIFCTYLHFCIFAWGDCGDLGSETAVGSGVILPLFCGIPGRLRTKVHLRTLLEMVLVFKYNFGQIIGLRNPLAGRGLGGRGARWGRIGCGVAVWHAWRWTGWESKRGERMTLVRCAPEDLNQMALRLLDVTARVRGLACLCGEEELGDVALHTKKAEEWLAKLEGWTLKVTSEFEVQAARQKAERLAARVRRGEGPSAG